MVKIRLARHGSNKRPFYKIIVADNRRARNGRFIEKIGFFNPLQKDKNKKVSMKIKRIAFWIKNGAILSERVKNICKTYNK
ncbi:30S ribosomal protein S16 [Buchnera aphidicola (Neophyllaphis podocarpi)]|uniref:30S ribosomal protein S16 n=1 Tax=Buchnera aphidicola TaxID=9 RepID=UPI0031B855D2